jgi:hypothetical protein
MNRIAEHGQVGEVGGIVSIFRENADDNIGAANPNHVRVVNLVEGSIGQVDAQRAERLPPEAVSDLFGPHG